jgi:hypothetical protein
MNLFSKKIKKIKPILPKKDWTVLDDSARKDHKPILINLSGLSNIRLPLRPPNHILHILDWRSYTNATNEGFFNMTIEPGVSVDDKNRFLIELITQSAKEAAKVGPGSTRSKFVCLA